MEGTGLYAYGFRYYDPMIGRFTGVDPIADKFAFVSGYNYAENSPIANIDLHGLQAYYAADGSLLYKVQRGQGPTQIAQDLTLNFGVPTGWQRIVNHPDNAGYFSHIVGPGRSDMNNSAYRALNMNEGNILKIAGPPTGRTLYPSSQNAVDFSADDETFFNQTINLMQKFSVENRLNGGDFLESGKYSATSFLSSASKRNGALDFYFGSTDQFGLTTYKRDVSVNGNPISITFAIPDGDKLALTKGFGSDAIATFGMLNTNGRSSRNITVSFNGNQSLRDDFLNYIHNNKE